MTAKYGCLGYAAAIIVLLCFAICLGLVWAASTTIYMAHGGVSSVMQRWMAMRKRSTRPNCSGCGCMRRLFGRSKS